MTAVENFAALHVPRNPLVLCNIWDCYGQFRTRRIAGLQ